MPAQARILGHDAPTMVMTTAQSNERRRKALESQGVGVRVVGSEECGVDLGAALAVLRASGVRSLLVEGGARVITSFLRARLADRVVVGIAPTIVGAGTEAVGDLRINRISDGLQLTNRSMHPVGEDLLIAADVSWAEAG
jgi:riboflavin biosynthesis pyrimidine reductase